MKTIGTQLILGAFLLAAAWLPQPASALTYGEKTETCPLDGKPFTYQAVASYTQFGMQLDLRPIGALVAPIPLPVCPESGFVVYREDYSEQDIAFFRDLVRTSEYRTIREDNTDYFVAAHQVDRLDGDSWTIAFLTLQATWEVQDQPAMYRRYAELALERFETAGATLSRGGEDAEKWWVAKLIPVNLHRRLGRFEAARLMLAELPYLDEPEDSGVRQVGLRLRDLIAAKDPAPAEVAPRDQ